MTIEIYEKPTATNEREGATRSVRSDVGERGLSWGEGGAWVSQIGRTRQSCPHTEASVHGEQKAIKAREGAQSLQCVVSAISCARRHRLVIIMMTWCVVLLKRHSSIVRLPGRYVQARSAIPSSALSSQGGARGKLSCPRHDTWG